MGWWVIDNLRTLEKPACISYMQVRLVTKSRRNRAVGGYNSSINIWVGMMPGSREIR